MTGIECLRQSLLDKGYTRSQTESKVVLGVLEIITQCGEQYNREDALLQDIKNLEMQKRSIEDAIERSEYRQREECEKLNKIREEILWYINQFYEALNNCETPEGRDAMKKVQMFVNTVDVDTKYDNTAFIAALGAILANVGGIEPLKQLKKINPAIPELQLKNPDEIEVSELIPLRAFRI